MDFRNLEDLLHSTGFSGSPAAQIYIYRILHSLVLQGSSSDHELLSYRGAKKIAPILGLTSHSRLVALYRDLGLGELKLEIDENKITAELTPKMKPDKSPAVNQSFCELERGLLDGSLELITGIPVTTIKTSCGLKGSDNCRFEALKDVYGGHARYKPQSAANLELSNNEGNPFSFHKGQNIIKAWYMDTIERELSRSRRHGRELSLLYVDIDDLGEINSMQGNDAGDQVISAIAGAISGSCRAEDSIWHHNEDEFVIALAETCSGCAEVVAKRVMTKIISAAEHLDIAATLSASIGYSTYPTYAENLPELLSSARSALYLAKSMGKGGIQGAFKNDEVEIHTQIEECDREADETSMWPSFRPQKQQRKKDSEEKIEVKAEPIQSYETSGPGINKTGSGNKKERKEKELASFSILIASQAPIMLEGMRQVMLSDENINIVKEVSNPSVFLDAISDLRPDLIFAEESMAASKRFAALKLLQSENLPCKFAVFAVELDQNVLRMAADFKVDGVIMQKSSPHDIRSALHLIYQGQTILPDEIKKAVNDLESNRRLLSELSERELEVLRLVAEGNSNSQISKELYITVNTVRFHLANIYQKLNVSNRTEAAKYYLKQGLDSDGQITLL